MIRYDDHTLQRWGITREEAEKELEKIKIKGLRLKHDEKEDLLWHIHEHNPTEDELKETILFYREIEKEEKEDYRKTRQFVKEIRRLERKYDCFDYEHKTLDELTEMWLNDYFELYFKDCHLESIHYYGAKEYAQVYLHTRGVIPECEVTLWQ